MINELFIKHFVSIEYKRNQVYSELQNMSYLTDRNFPQNNEDPN